MMPKNMINMKSDDRVYSLYEEHLLQVNNEQIIESLMAIGMNPTAESADDSLCNFSNENETHQHSAVCMMTRENSRMRQVINNAACVMTEWIRQTQQQTEGVILLAGMLKESIQKQNNLQHDLDSVIKQMKVHECQWAEERMTFEDMQIANDQIIGSL